MRIGKKSVYQGNTSETSYVVSGTQILSETKGSNTIYYIYDDKGLPTGIVYNGVTYTYRKNVQGDIIAILDSAGTEVVNYTYNAWGLIINASGSLVSTLGYANPFRYRGYYYDTETGYYYLNSRYYDPVTGRFLNADGFVSTGQGVLGTNMFAYCGNNPVNRVDRNGEFSNPVGEFFNSVIYTAQTNPGAYIGCGILAVADGPLPFGDIVACLFAAGVTKTAEIERKLKPINTVYALVDDKGVPQYIGRTKSLSTREAAHKNNPDRKHLKLRIIKQNLNYYEARGLEQIEMLKCHTINTSNKMNNQINGISPLNVLAGLYIEAGKGVAGYTENQISNMILCWAEN